MADSGTSPADDQVSITVKGQNDAKYAITISASATVRDLKDMLSSESHANLPAERQRLIYSGRVLKDNDTMASANIKSGHTVHLVRSAESNTRQNPTTSATQPSVTPAVPTNIAAGTGNSPLAGLTGARFAGFHGLPSAAAFGPDGGMQPPMSPDQMERLLDNPMFLSQLTEFMNSPQAMQLMEPMLSQNPGLREMMRNPEVRRVLFSPESIRTQLQISRAMGGGAGGAGSFPAPGETDNTGTGTNTNTQHPASGETNPGQTTSPPPNPFAALFPGAGGTGNPPPSNNPLGGGMNPTQLMLLESLLAGGAGGAGGASGAGGLGGLAGLGGLGGQQQGGGNLPNFAELFGGGFPASPPAPADNRPPEERYAEQLRQLNEMGFYDFERNVEALRRSGGNVQGAVEHLLGQP